MSIILARIKLYLCLISLVEKERGHFSYISSKLDFYNENFSDLKSLLSSLQGRVQEKKFLMNNREIEHIFRVMAECISFDESWIDFRLKEEIFSTLEPFMKFHDHQQLIDRYSSFM